MWLLIKIIRNIAVDLFLSYAGFQILETVKNKRGLEYFFGYGVFNCLPF